MTMLRRTIEVFIVVCVLLQITNGRDCFGTLVYRTSDNQMKAILVAKDVRPPLPLTFPIGNCSGAFAIDGDIFVCLAANGRTGNTYNLTSGNVEPTNQFVITNDFFVPKQARLFYNSQSKILCTSINATIFCGKLETSWSPTSVLSSSPSFTFLTNSVTYMTGSPDNDTMTLRVMGNSSNGSKEMQFSANSYFPEANSSTMAASTNYMGVASQVAMSDAGNRTFIVTSSPQELRVCDPSTSEPDSIFCSSSTLQGPALSKFRQILSPGMMRYPDDFRTAQCPAFIVYFQPNFVPGTPLVQGEPKRDAKKLEAEEEDINEAFQFALSQAPAIELVPANRTFFPVPLDLPMPASGIAFIRCAPSATPTVLSCYASEVLYDGTLESMAWTPFEHESFAVTSNSNACPPPSPGPSFICLDGTWTSVEDVNTTTIVATGTVTVFGNATFSESIVINGLQSSLVIQGCLSLSGDLIIQLSDDDIETLTKSKDGGWKFSKTTELISSSECPISLSGINIKLRRSEKDKNKCIKVKMITKTESEGARVTAVFEIDKTPCNLWWIILVSVLGAVLIIAIITLILVFTLNKKARACIRPYSTRNEKKAETK